MGLWDWFIVKKKRKKNVWKWRGKPLYRKGHRVYWKGVPVDDDEFEAVRMDKRELRAYNSAVRRANSRIRRRKRKV